MFQSLQRTSWTVSVTPELRLPTWGLSAKWCLISSRFLWSITRGFLLTSALPCQTFKSTPPGGIKIRLRRLVLSHVILIPVNLVIFTVCWQCADWGEWETQRWQPHNSLAYPGWMVRCHHLIYWGWNMYEIKLYSHLTCLCLVYISKWRRVKLVLGCSPFEQRHTGELMAGFVEDVSEAWGIRSKVTRLCFLSFTLFWRWQDSAPTRPPIWPTWWPSCPTCNGMVA